MVLLLFKQNTHTHAQSKGCSHPHMDKLTHQNKCCGKKGKHTVTWTYPHGYKACNYNLAGTTDLIYHDLCQRCSNIDVCFFFFFISLSWKTSRKPKGVSCGFQEVVTSSLILTLLLYPLSVWHPHSSHPHTQNKNILLGSKLTLNTVYFLTVSHTHTWTGISTDGDKKEKKHTKIKNTVLHCSNAAKPDIFSAGVHICTHTRQTEQLRTVILRQKIQCTVSSQHNSYTHNTDTRKIMQTKEPEIPFILIFIEGHKTQSHTH